MTARRALLSVYHKDGIVDLGKGLVSRDFEIVSTGGTAEALRKGGVAVTGVSEATGFPEILGEGSRRCIPRSTGAYSPAATSRATGDPSESTGSPSWTWSS